MNTDLMFSSKTDMWSTPQTTFDALHKEFRFTLDVCATPENAKCRRFFTQVQDGLLQRWSGRCWMNPPYGREIGKWVRKAYESAQTGVVCVCVYYLRVLTRRGGTTTA